MKRTNEKSFDQNCQCSFGCLKALYREEKEKLLTEANPPTNQQQADKQFLWDDASISRR